MSTPKDPPLAEFRLLETDASVEEKVDGICQLFTDDCVLEDTTSPEIVRGNDALRTYCTALLRGLPDFLVKPEEIFEDSRTSIMVLSVSGTHEGEFMGFAPTGKHLDWRAVAIYRCNEDCTQVRHETWAYDAAGIAEQLEEAPVA